MLNIICNFSPHEIETCNDRDPSWMIRLEVINGKNLFHKRFGKNKAFTNNDNNLKRLRSLQNNLSNRNETSNILQKFLKNYLTVILARATSCYRKL